MTEVGPAAASNSSTAVRARSGRPTRTQVVFDVAVAVALLGLLVLTGAQSSSDTLVVVLLAAAFGVRRLQPWLMSLLAVAASALQLVNDPVYAAALIYFPLFFTLGAHPRAALRRWGLTAAVGAVLVAAGWAVVNFPSTSVVDADGLPARVVAGGVIGALVAVLTIGGWTAGFVRWQGQRAMLTEFDAMEQRRLRDLYQQEQERSRIAADMHDVVAHSWAVVAAQADGARYALRSDPDGTDRALRVIAGTARSAMTDVRTLLDQLRNRSSEPPEAPVLGFEKYGELLSRMRDSGMQVRHEVSGKPSDERLLALTAHRLLGESLTNALKHGDLTRPVEVSEDWSDGYRLLVVNALPAADSSAGRTSSSGHGVPGMIERAVVAGGELTAGVVLGRWEVRAHIPAADRAPGLTS